MIGFLPGHVMAWRMQGAPEATSCQQDLLRDLPVLETRCNMLLSRISARACTSCSRRPPIRGHTPLRCLVTGFLGAAPRTAKVFDQTIRGHTDQFISTARP